MAVAWTLLLSPLSPEDAGLGLADLRVPRRLAEDVCRALAAVRALALRPGHDPRREAVRLVRRAGLSSAAAAALLARAPSSGRRRLAEEIQALLRRGLDRTLRPSRLAKTAEIARIAGLASGPSLGRLLGSIDEERAVGTLRSAAAVRRFARNLAGS